MRASIGNFDEAGLIERVLGGDAPAFEELVRRYMRRAFSVAYRVLRQREDAEDVTQEVFMTVLRKIGTFDRSRPFGPWFFRIVVNRALNARKSRELRQMDPIPEGAIAAEESPAAALERGEVSERFRRAVESLPERQRLVVCLSDLEEMSSAEIGEILEISDGTVRWHLHQARVALRKALAPLKEGEQ